MDYFKYHIFFDKNGKEYVADLLTDYLSAIGFDSFEDAADGLIGYHPAPQIPDTELKNYLFDFEYADDLHYEAEFIKSQNWNEKWEKESYKPQIYDGQCVVHGPSFTDVPSLKYDILIDPKLSFGSGHHETTTLMISRILKTDFAGKSVCDMGCGTAVLAILTRKMGASPVTGIDIDDWAYKNAQDNCRLNGIDDIDLRLGGVEALPNKTFDYFLANINRNILLDGMPYYAKCMHPGSHLYLSGFYTEDIPVVDKYAAEQQLKRLDVTEKNNWVSVDYVKF